MANVHGALSLPDRYKLRASLSRTALSILIHALPKVELHIHIEGTLSPALKWRFAQRNDLTLRHPRTGAIFTSLSDYQASHLPVADKATDNAEETLSFFEAYYGGFEVLKTTQDYEELAWEYCVKASDMGVRYCEVFFDPQGHTRTGVAWETMMGGFRQASERAEGELNLWSKWIMCLLRDESPESGMEHYLAALPYRDVIVGIGLDSNEDQRPPLLFEGIYRRARADGFRITAHCDVGKAYPLEHVRQTVCCIGGTGADRVDHGLNVTDSPEIIEEIKHRGMGMTICPWSYIRHQPLEEVFRRIRVLFDAGVKIAIASDDPAFMEDTWVLENLLLVAEYGKFDGKDIVRLARDSVEVCWAPEEVKQAILDEIRSVASTYGVT